MNVVGEGWRPSATDELVIELRTILEPRGVRVCPGARQAGAGTELKRDPGGMVRIRVWRDGDPPLTVRPTAGFDPGPLPPDAFAFALARAVDGLLQQAEVVPREGQTRSARDRLDFPDETGIDFPDETVASSAFPPPPVTGPPPNPPARSARGAPWKAWIGAGATARWLSTGEGHFGGVLSLGAHRKRLSLLGELHASGGLAREGNGGQVSSSLFGGSAGVLWRESTSAVSVSLGPVLGLFAARFAGRADAAATAQASDAWRPVLFGGARLQLDWSIAPLLVWAGFEGSAVLVGAEGADDLGGVSRITGFVGSALVGVGWQLR